MKQYVIDELRPADHQRIKEYLDQRYAVEGFQGLYWIPLDSSVLTPEQMEHEACQPFYFALELLPDKLACELLVRSKERLRCSCVQIANEAQRNWLISVVDAFFEELRITT